MHPLYFIHLSNSLIDICILVSYYTIRVYPIIRIITIWCCQGNMNLYAWQQELTWMLCRIITTDGAKLAAMCNGWFRPDYLFAPSGFAPSGFAHNIMSACLGYRLSGGRLIIRIMISNLIKVNDERPAVCILHAFTKTIILPNFATASCIDCRKL